MTQPGLQVRRADYSAAADRAALIGLLDAYAQDRMGGGEALPADVRARLCDDLARHPLAVSFIAWLGDQPVGLANCFEGYSTFKARPLLNVHDMVVHPAHRARGIGQALLAACEAHARERGCCKLTLGCSPATSAPCAATRISASRLRARPARRPGLADAEVAVTLVRGSGHNARSESHATNHCP